MTDKKIPYLIALSPILFLIVLLTFNVVMYDDAIGGANQLALLFSGALAAIIGILDSSILTVNSCPILENSCA